MFIHGGPFANIAHGCNSVIATRTALSCADWVVTEAGFGADLGAEKFLDIKCRAAGLWPSAVVVVATVRALKYHGGVAKDNLTAPDADAVRAGLVNLTHHVANLRGLGLPVVVAVNRFATDSDEELQVVEDGCAALGVRACPFTAWADGGAGGIGLAQAVMEAARPSEPHFVYDVALPLRQKAEGLVQDWYGGAAVEFSPQAEAELDALERAGCGGLPICMAKTQYSVSDDAKALGAPTGFTLRVRGVKLLAGAGFVVLQAGSILKMPGLSKHPAAESIDIDASGEVTGLF